MNVQITFRGMDHSPVIEEHTLEQLAKVKRFLAEEREPVTMHVIVTGAFTHKDNRIEIDLKSPHYDLHVHKQGPELYKILDEAIDVLYQQLLEEKKKQKNPIHKDGFHRP